jgi:cyclophilin family peptidyl-prolyl cis-trans isomerase
VSEDQSLLLRRRRRARLVGAGVVLATVIAAGALAARPPTSAAPKPGGEDAVSLPPGCERASPRARPPQGPRRPPPLPTGGGDLRAVIHTSCGPLTLNLFEARAPRNVASFVALARAGFYDGLLWHRIDKDFVVQTGDPNDDNLNPPDGPRYEVADELAGTRARDYTFGVVAMANRGPDTAGSQFFIVVHDLEGARRGDVEPAGLQPDYTIIGEVEPGSWETLKRLSAVPTKGGLELVTAAEPVVPVVVDSVEISSSGN